LSESLLANFEVFIKNKEIKQMSAVLLGPSEVLVIVIITAVVVFFIARRSKKKR